MFGDRCVPGPSIGRRAGALSGVIWLALSGGLAHASTDALPPDVLRSIRAHYVSPGYETRYLSGAVDLNGDGRPEPIVYIVGPMACGTGGCSTLVFTPDGAGYRLVSSIGVSRPPIRAAATSTKGWRDLIVRIGGGGAKPADVELLFDGKSYPENPTVGGPHVKAADLAGSQIVIADFDSFQDAEPLPGEAAASDSAADRRLIESQIRSGELEAPRPVGYVCKGHEDEPFQVAFYNQTDPHSAVVTFGDRQEILFAAPSGSGARYTNPRVDFWEHHGEATVKWSGESYTCAARS